MLRIPGTPASAAYTDESYAMSKKGELDLNLGVNLVFSVIGGLFGVAILIVCAPLLAEFAINFSSFEYFWLALLGLTCAVFIAHRQSAQGLRRAAVRPAHQLHRHRSGCGISALHLRQRRAVARHQLHSGDDRHVRDLGDCCAASLPVDQQGAVLSQQDRQHLRSAYGALMETLLAKLLPRLGDRRR